MGGLSAVNARVRYIISAWRDGLGVNYKGGWVVDVSKRAERGGDDISTYLVEGVWVIISSSSW